MPNWTGINRCKTPLRPQFQTTECGVAVLRIMLAYYGKQVTAREARQRTGVSRDCLNAADIRRAARAYGLICEARTLETEALRGRQLPFVVHLRFLHFVVVEHIGRNFVRINCPASGIIQQSLAEFDNAFTGIVLEMRPGPEFVTDDAGLQQEQRWWRSLAKGRSAPVALAAALHVCRAFIVIAIARGLERHFSPLGIGLALGGAAVAGFGAKVCLERVSEGIYEELRGRIVDRLEGVDFAFYVYRLPAVLIDCMGCAGSMAETVSFGSIAAGLALVEAVTLLVGTFRMSVRCGICFAVVFAAWLAAVAVCTGWNRRIERSLQGEGADEAALAFSAIENAAVTKLADGVDRLRLEMQGSEAREQQMQVEVGTAPMLLAVGPYALVIACVCAVLLSTPPDRNLMAAMGVIAAAMAAACAPLVEQRGVREMLERKVAQVGDVLNEPMAETQEVIACDKGCAGEAAVVLDSVTFGFNPNKPPLICGLSLTVPQGEQVGLTGPSGGGKTSITELMVGLHSPWEGQILVEGRPIARIPRAECARVIARIDRRPVMFAATLRENILLGDELITEQDLRSAIRDAALDGVLQDRPCGLETLVEEDGRNFSGGQLQRIEIARALARNPRILILDDALDGLDMATERHVRAALRRRGCTVLLVTHRAASLAECDRVIEYSGGDGGLASGACDCGADLSIFGETAERVAVSRLVGEHVEALCTAFARVAKSAALTDASALAGLEREEAISLLSTANGLSVRTIRFIDERWWTRDFGHAVAFRRDGAPVALLQGWNGARVFDPVNGESRPLRFEFRELEPEAYTFGCESRSVPKSLGEWLGRLLAPVQANLIAACGLSMLISALGCLALFLMAGSGTVDTVLLAISLAGTAALCGWLAMHNISQLRAGMLSARGVLIRGLTTRADPDLSRFWEPRRVYRAIAGLYGMAISATDVAGRGCSAATLLAVACLTFSHRSIRNAVVLSVMALLIAGVSTVLAFVECRLVAREEARTRASRHWLSSTLQGTRRLYSLDRLGFALRQWLRMDDGRRRAGSLSRRIAELSAGLRLPMGMVPVAAVWLVGDRPTLYECALAAICGMAATELASVAGRLAYARIGRKAASELMRLEHEHGQRTFAGDEGTVHANHIACQYPGAKEPLFRDLSLSVSTTGITVLAGPSGAGKSTLLRLLLQFQRPKSGEIRVGTHAMAEVNTAVWRRGIAGVFQGDSLSTVATVRGQLASGGLYSVSDIWHALEAVELAGEVRRMPMGLQSIVGAETLSWGQQQRLLIARALMARPRLLLLDEGTNAIPERQQARILARLRASGVACLIVTHRQSLIEAADWVHVIDHGVTYSGPPAGLIAHTEIPAPQEEDQETQDGSPLRELCSRSAPRRGHPFRAVAVEAFERPMIRTIPRMRRPMPRRLWILAMLLVLGTAALCWHWSQAWSVNRLLSSSPNRLMGGDSLREIRTRTLR